MIKSALLVLEDGTQFHGRAIGATGSAVALDLVPANIRDGRRDLCWKLAFMQRFIPLLFCLTMLVCITYAMKGLKIPPLVWIFSMNTVVDHLENLNWRWLLNDSCVSSYRKLWWCITSDISIVDLSFFFLVNRAVLVVGSSDEPSRSSLLSVSYHLCFNNAGFPDCQ